MKFLPALEKKVIELTDEQFKIAEFWGYETSKHSIEMLRKFSEPSAAEVAKDLSNHDMSAKAECAVDLYLHRNIEKAVGNSELFSHGNSFAPLIPDNIIWGLYDYDEREQIGDCIGVEVKSTHRKEGLQVLNLVIKLKQFRDYLDARGNGLFDAFVYVLTVTVRHHANRVELVGFAREEELEKSVSANNNPDEHGQPTIHFLDLHPMKFLTHKRYKTSKTLRDYT
jgi:hypothetical protein